MRRLLTVGCNTGNILVADYDTIEEFLDPLSMQHMGLLSKFVIPVGLDDRVLLEARYSSKRGRDDVTFTLRSDLQSYLSFIDETPPVSAKLKLGVSGMIFVGDVSQFMIIKKHKIDMDQIPEFAKTQGALERSRYGSQFKLPVDEEAFYQLDLIIARPNPLYHHESTAFV